MEIPKKPSGSDSSLSESSNQVLLVFLPLFTVKLFPVSAAATGTAAGLTSMGGGSGGDGVLIEAGSVSLVAPRAAAA